MKTRLLKTDSSFLKMKLFNCKFGMRVHTIKNLKHLLVMQVESIFKRSHEKRPFKLEKITDAILKL